MAAGAPHGIAPAGYRAIELLRLEKGYRAWGADITPNDNPFEAGLGWAVKLKSGRPFLGREATERIAAAPLRKRLMTFTVADPAVVLAGRETILRDGRAVGYLASGGWGYTIGSQYRPRLCAQRGRGRRRLSRRGALRARGRHRAGAGAASHRIALRSGQRPGEGLTAGNRYPLGKTASNRRAFPSHPASLPG